MNDDIKELYKLLDANGLRPTTTVTKQINGLAARAKQKKAIDQAIKTSRKPIGKREATMIHGLLKGHS